MLLYVQASPIGSSLCDVNTAYHAHAREADEHGKCSSHGWASATSMRAQLGGSCRNDPSDYPFFSRSFLSRVALRRGVANYSKHSASK